MKKRMLSKKSLIAVVVFSMLFSLIGCSNGSAPEDSVKGFFDAMKKGDVKEASKYIQNADPDIGLDTFEKDLLTIISAKIDYSIESKTIDGDNSTVKVNTKAPDLEKIFSSLKTKLQEEAEKLAKEGKITDENSEKMVMDITKRLLTDELGKSDYPVRSSNADIKLTNDAGKKMWLINSDIDLSETIFGNPKL